MASRKKIEGLLYGVIQTVALENGVDILKEQDNRNPTRTILYRIGDEINTIHMQEEKVQTLAIAIAENYPNQVSSESVIKNLVQTIRSWFETEQVLNMQKIQEVTEDLMLFIEEDVKKYDIYLPILGLEIDNLVLKLGNGEIFSTKHENDEFKDYQAIIEKNKLPESEINRLSQSSACFRIQLHAQKDKAVAFAEENAELALDILRFYVGISTFDIFLKKQKRIMGLLGHIPVKDGSAILWQEEGTERWGTSHALITEPIGVPLTMLQKITATGLEKVNHHLGLVILGEGSDLSRRLFRSIKWFAKGTQSRNIADSFLSYALAIESLFSEGRTPQSDYAKYIAALVNQGDKNTIYPYNGIAATDFYKKLNISKNKEDAYNLIEKELNRSFDLRNDIAHGREIGTKIELEHLITFETLVRNAILAFIIGEWTSIKEFRDKFMNKGGIK